MKKLTAIFLCFAMALSLAACGNTTSSTNESSTPESSVPPASSEASDTSSTAASQEPASQEETEVEAGNTLVVYFSATGNTEQAATYIADITGGDLFELEPADPYTDEDLNYNNEDSRVSQEYADESLRDVELVSDTVENWDSYDTVFIGYPIWWGIAAWPVDTFVEANNFTGKTVIPFATSASSGLGESGQLLAELAGTGDWQEGMRFRSSVSEGDVQEWLDSLNQEGTRAHALRYDYFNGSNTEYYFLVYVPGGGNSSHSGLGQSTSIFGTTVKLELEETGNDGTLFSILSTAEKAPNLKITLGGERIPCYVDTVDFNPTVYYIVPQYDELDPDATDFFMPERISVVQIVGNSNVGVVEIQDDDVAFDILVGIDSAPYLDLEHDIYGKPDGTGGYDFKDGFEIRIEYQIHNELLSHADMITCLAFEQDGSYYLIDDRPDNGRIFRQIDEAFYLELGSLFEELS